MTGNYIHWDVDPTIFSIGSIDINYYSILFVGGVWLAAEILRKICLKENVTETQFNKLFIYCFVGLVLGARIGHCLFYESEYYLHHPLQIILPWKYDSNGEIIWGYHGLASHGSAIGLLIAMFIFSRVEKIKLLKVFDYIAIAAPLGGMFIRLGNLMNSEILGMPTEVPWAFIFERIDEMPRHPAQLYEAISYLIFFIIIYVSYRKRHETVNNGFFFGLACTLIFTARFFIEFIKERQVNFEESMTIDMGQILSLPFIAIGIFFIIRGLKKSKGNITK